LPQVLVVECQPAVGTRWAALMQSNHRIADYALPLGGPGGAVAELGKTNVPGALMG
jgi:hypothetical protein